MEPSILRIPHKDMTLVSRTPVGPLPDLPQMMSDVAERLLSSAAVDGHRDDQSASRLAAEQAGHFGRSYFSFPEAKKKLGKTKRILWCVFDRKRQNVEQILL